MIRASLTLRLGVASSSLALLACEPPSDSSPEQSAGPALTEKEPYELEVTGARTCPLPSHLDPKNVRIVSYRIRLRGHDPGRVPANYFYASLVTTDGDRYLASYEGCSPLLLADPLKPGEEASGMVNFPIPPSKTPETLTYSPELLNRTSLESTREWKLQSEELAEKEWDREGPMP